jgi:ribosomal protein S12 methylthiotransferase accessory factor
MVGAIAEAIERYSAYQIDPGRLVTASFAQLGERAINPTSLVLYSEGQYDSPGFPYQRFDPDAEIAWVAARSLPSSDETFVPASFVFLNYPCRSATEYLASQTSSGLAAGPDLASAILGGLSELVERDGFLIHWLNRLQAPRVELSQLDGMLRSIITHFRRFGIEVHAYNLTTDLEVPVMMGLAVDPTGRRPAAAVGLGCHLNPIEALRKALMEMCQVYLGGNFRHRSGAAPEPLRAFQNVREPEDHSALFSMRETLAELAFLLDGRRLQRLEDLPSRASGQVQTDLDTCLELVARAGSRVLYVELTAPDIAPSQLRVARVLATELQPIDFGFGRDRRGGRRLYEVPVSLGYGTTDRTEVELNPCPHPLA